MLGVSGTTAFMDETPLCDRGVLYNVNGPIYFMPVVSIL